MISPLHIELLVTVGTDIGEIGTWRRSPRTAKPTLSMSSSSQQRHPSYLPDRSLHEAAAGHICASAELSCGFSPMACFATPRQACYCRHEVPEAQSNEGQRQ
jgi:hypothetical protein